MLSVLQLAELAPVCATAQRLYIIYILHSCLRNFLRQTIWKPQLRRTSDAVTVSGASGLGLLKRLDEFDVIVCMFISRSIL